MSYVVELANGGSFHTRVLQTGYRCAMILSPSTLRGIEQGLGQMGSSAPQPLLAAGLPAAFSVYPGWLYSEGHYFLWAISWKSLEVLNKVSH